MTQPQLGSFESIPLSLIRPSRTNPRKHFDDLAMQELTRSVQEMGVTQPILIRPMPKYFAVEDIGVWKVYETNPITGDRKEPWVDLFAKKGLIPGADAGREPAEKRAAELNAEDPAFELVSGERRYRAAKASGRTVVPAIIRALSDEEALEIQMIENLQRADLHPVEEAEGFRVLLHTGLDVEDIAKKAGKTVAHVQRIVKLLSLDVDAKQLFLDGHMTLGHALLLARLTPLDQERAVRYLLNGQGDWSKTPLAEMITRRIENLKNNRWAHGDRLIEHTEAHLKAWIESNVLLQLASAPWHLADAQLLPIAGACTDCPKRTGANAGLFADITVDDDTCTDPACFADKGAAQSKRVLAAAKESGTKLLKISAAASNAPLPAPVVQQVKGSTEVVTNQKVKQGQWVEAKEGECNSTVQAVVADGPDKGALRWVCPDQKCKVHKHTVYQTYSSGSSAPKETPEQIAARELKNKRERAVTLAVFQRIVDSYAIDTQELLREVIDAEVDNIYGDDFPWAEVCAWMGVTVTRKKTEDVPLAAERCIREALPKLPEDDLFALLFLLRNERVLSGDNHAHRDSLIKLAKANGVPKVLSVITDAEKTFDKENAPKTETAPTPAKSAAKKAAKKAAAKRPHLSPEARKRIADNITKRFNQAQADAATETAGAR